MSCPITSTARHQNSAEAHPERLEERWASPSWIPRAAAIHQRPVGLALETRVAESRLHLYVHPTSGRRQVPKLEKKSNSNQQSLPRDILKKTDSPCLTDVKLSFRRSALLRSGHLWSPVTGY